MTDDQVKIYLPYMKSPRITAIGGGHGLSTMLRGLKKYTKNITAIVTVADDGGSSGWLRQDMGMLPPGDIRNCILALANTEPTMEQLLNYRFEEGSLTGQSFGNLFLAALNGISDSFDQAVARMSEVLAVTGKVLPVTNSNVHLEAIFEDGTTVLGESKIFQHKKRRGCRISRVRLTPRYPKALDESIEAIEQADMIVIGPGSLYTSIIPNFLVGGVSEAVAASKAPKVYVCNITTQEGETEGYTAADHIRGLIAHARPGVVDFCVINNRSLPEDVRRRYMEESAEELAVNRPEIESMGVKVFEYPLADGASQYARHDPDQLARALISIMEAFYSRGGRPPEGRPHSQRETKE